MGGVGALYAKVRGEASALLAKISSQANGRHTLCITLWWCSQAFRSALMPALRGNAAALSGERAGVLLTSFVLVDKFVVSKVTRREKKGKTLQIAIKWMVIDLRGLIAPLLFYDQLSYSLAPFFAA